MTADLFLRYLLEFLYLIPGCVLGYLSMGGSLRYSVRNTFAKLALLIIFAIVGGAALCTWLRLPSNTLLLPFVVIFLLMRHNTTALPLHKILFIMSISGAVMTIITWGSVIFCCTYEQANPYTTVKSIETSLVVLGVSSVVVLLMAPMMIRRVRWLMNTFDDPRVWRITWVFPALLTILLLICMPMDYQGLLANRYRPIGIMLAVVLLLLLVGFLMFLYFMARALTERAELEQENQLLQIQREHYTHLHASLNETRTLRHDFRQHLRVIVGLVEKERYQELRQYLHEYDSKMIEPSITLCPNPALDAIALYYDRIARREKVNISWRIDLPEQLPLPEADLCMVVGNLLENALHATTILPEEQRRIDVVYRMLSEGMVGLSVENTWDSESRYPSKHPKGQGIGMKSVTAAVHKYEGTIDIHPDMDLYSVRVLMNVPME